MAEYNYTKTNTLAPNREKSEELEAKEKAYIEHLCRRQEKMEADRSNFENLWQECMDYIVPRKGDIRTTRSEGDKRGHDLFDSTAIMANNLLAGALHGMLTNPTTRFFDLIMGDPALDDDEEVKAWLQDVAEKMFIVFQNSNFQTEVHEIYLDEGAIGTACLYISEHDERVVHFSARAMKEIFIQENNLGLVDVVHRKFQFTPRQMVQEFGYDKLPSPLQKEYDQGSEDKITIIHAVHPKGEHEESLFNYKSCYFWFDKKLKISEGGFREFPYAVPRWTKTSGESYGRGPGMDMLPDTKMVNRMMETTLKGAQKTVDPPMMVSDDAVIGRVRLIPGGLTMVRPMSEVPIRPLIVDARVDFGYQAVEDVRRRIRSGFYVDQLQLNEGPQMTATEVMQRTEEKLRLMGPVLGRQHFEFLRPVIERVFGIMVRKKMISAPPRQIQGRNFDVRYSSLIARVQRTNEGQNLARAIGIAAPILQLYPETKDNLNGDKALRYILDIFGVPHKIFSSSYEMQQIRESRAQAQSELLQQEKDKHEAEIVGQTLPGIAQLQMASQQRSAG